MENQRAERVGDLLLEMLAELLRRDVRDPRLSAVTLTHVKVSKDLRHARIYFDVPREHDRESALAGLKSASGFFRSKLAKELKLRFVPAIEFSHDASEDEAQRVEALLDQIKARD
jgi:ribosome-binding factor A